MIDRAGKELKIGQTVDLLYSDMLQGIIVGLKDSPIQVAGQFVKPTVVIQVLLTQQPNDRGETALYVVHDAPELPSKSDKSGESKLIQ